ncbi:N-ATPase subunit AtpR [Hyphococcus luteus]|nr:ATP synthase subunit I [Marinicaulis flavus]
MNPVVLIAAAGVGFAGGLAYFHMLWRATKAHAAGRSDGLAFGMMIFVRLAAVLAVLGAALALGAGALEIGVAMLGFLAARHLSLARARRAQGAAAEKERSHAH